MPQFIVPAILAAVTVGTTVYSAVSRPGQPSAAAAGPTPLQRGDAARQAMLDRESRARAISRNLPGLQEQLGGSVSPEYYAMVSSLLTGDQWDQNTALNSAMRFFGLGDKEGGSLPSGSTDWMQLSGLDSGAGGATNSPWGTSSWFGGGEFPDIMQLGLDGGSGGYGGRGYATAGGLV